MTVPRLQALGYEIVAISAPFTFGGAILEWEGIPLLPCLADMAGADTIVPNHSFFKADLTITLCDPFMFHQVPDQLAKIPLAMWFPVDCEPVSDADITVLRDGGGIPIAMSRFGEKMLRDEGADPFYVPHGIDTSAFCPGDTDYRETIGADENIFIIGINAMNRDETRKGWGEQFEAFARFHSRFPDTALSVNAADVNPKGLNLPKLALRLGISDVVKFPDTFAYNMHMISQDNLVSWYRGIDVLSLCSYGEGFGLPLVEAQSCGTPVITTDGSAMTELCGAGWLVSATNYWAPRHNAWWRRPDVSDIAQAYTDAYFAWKDGTLPRKEARDFALQYDADQVAMQYWKPALEAIEGMIG